MPVKSILFLSPSRLRTWLLLWREEGCPGLLWVLEACVILPSEASQPPELSACFYNPAVCAFLRFEKNTGSRSKKKLGWIWMTWDYMALFFLSNLIQSNSNCFQRLPTNTTACCLEKTLNQKVVCSGQRTTAVKGYYLDLPIYYI